MLEPDERDIIHDQYCLLSESEKGNYEFMIFDTDYKIGGEEDVHLFNRIFQAGYKMVMSGYSCFWHKEGATRWNDDIEIGFKEKNKQIEQVNYDRFKDKWGYDIRTDGLRWHEEVIEEHGNVLL